MNLIAQKLHKVFTCNPDVFGIWVNSRSYTYAELSKLCSITCKALDDLSVGGSILIYGEKSVAAYIGIISSVLYGKPFVPINPEFPIEKNKRVVGLANAQCIICEMRCVDAVREITDGFGVHILGIDANGHIEIFRSKSQADLPLLMEEVAYIMFTSGTTGLPKGIPITYENLNSYLDNICPIVNADNASRFTNLFDFSFDLSVHDMFVCWAHGACLYVIPPEIKALPDAFIKTHELTHWFSVPSVAHFLRIFNRLTPCAFPSLKNVLFCGESLSFDLAKLWFYAAPNAKIYNLYGPTEATIAFSFFEVTKCFIEDWKRGMVPIGLPLGDMAMRICLDEKGESPSTSGMLMLKGAQVAHGYLSDEVKTRQSFTFHADYREYSTGDVAEFDQEYGFICLGRSDRQVKVRGYRVELDEIEATIERSFQDLIVAAIYSQDLDQITLFVQGDSGHRDSINRLCLAQLPSYMVPSKFVFTDSIRLNSNGKKDYGALAGGNHAKATS